MQIAFQADTGSLWTWTANDPGSDTGLGMRAGTNPSVNPSAISGSNHQIAFQANTRALWTVAAGGVSNTGLGMAAGTSPSIDNSVIAFQANTGNLWTVAPGGVWTATPLGMVAGTSPSRAAVGDVAFQAKGGTLYYLDEGNNGAGMKAGTSPSLNDNPATQVAFQGSNGSLFAGTITTEFVLGPPDLHLGTMPGTSPSINDKMTSRFRGATAVCGSG
jgi:hypothetical protein